MLLEKWRMKQGDQSKSAFWWHRKATIMFPENSYSKSFCYFHLLASAVNAVVQPRRLMIISLLTESNTACATAVTAWDAMHRRAYGKSWRVSSRKIGNSPQLKKKLAASNGFHFKENELKTPSIPKRRAQNTVLKFF